jgi:hypothetical protein
VSESEEQLREAGLSDADTAHTITASQQISDTPGVVSFRVKSSCLLHQPIWIGFPSVASVAVESSLILVQKIVFLRMPRFKLYSKMYMYQEL